MPAKVREFRAQRRNPKLLGATTIVRLEIIGFFTMKKHNTYEKKPLFIQRKYKFNDENDKRLERVPKKKF
jgi:hypothetical protein